MVAPSLVLQNCYIPSSQRRKFIVGVLVVKLVRNFEYIERPIKCTLDSCAVVRTDGSCELSGDNVVGNMVLQHSRRAVNGF